MLTKELYDKFAAAYMLQKSGISIGLVTGGLMHVYTNEACYMPYAKYWNKTQTHTVIGPKFGTKPTARPAAMAFLFASDSPFRDILMDVYDYSYRDWISWNAFQDLILDGVLVLEHSQINRWSVGSIMTLMMAHRESWGIWQDKKEQKFPSFKLILENKSASLSGYWNTAGVLGSAAYRVLPILGQELYTKLSQAPLTPRPVKSIYPDNPSPKLSQTIVDHHEWTSGLDIMYYCIWGVPTVFAVDIHDRLKLKPEKCKAELLKIYEPWS